MTQKMYGAYPTEKFTFKDDPDTFVEVRQANFAEEMERSKLLTTGKMSWREGGQEVTQHQEVSVAQIRAKDIYLTYVDSNIQGEDGKPLFKDSMREAKFMKVLGLLPAELILEWHDFVIQVNPDWAPGGKSEEE